MSDSSPIQELADSLASFRPDISIVIDKPKKRTGTWFLDVRLGDKLVVVQWQESNGFGVSCSADHGYGEGADEYYENIEAVRFRVLSLLLSDLQTVPSSPIRLSELRKSRGVSQVAVANLLRIQQGAVSRLERRSDVHVSSIRDYVRSLGGELRLMAMFPGGDCKLVELEEDDQNSASQKGESS